jgi:hypothetical protein
LDVRNSASNGHDGYTNTSTTDGQTYCYKWTGGTDNAGDVVESIRAGVAQINVQLRADSRYHIVAGAFGDGNTQFSFNATDNYNGVISDVGTVAEDDYFKLQVSDSSRTNCTFWCDPRVGNQD